MTIRVLLARGAGNNLGNNFCWNVAALLDKSIFTIREIPYFAQIAPVGGPHTMEQSMTNFDGLASQELAARVPWMGSPLASTWIGERPGSSSTTGPSAE